MMRTLILLIAVFTVLFSLATPVAMTTAVGFELRDGLLDRLDPLDGNAALFAGSVPLRAAGAVTFFYEKRLFRAAWTDGAGPLPQLDALIDAIGTVRDDALDPDRYHHTHLRELRDRLAADPMNVPLRLNLELVATDAWYFAARELGMGRADPGALDMGRASGTRWIHSSTSLLEQALVNGRFVQALDAHRPKQPEYDSMRRGWALLRAVADRGGWVSVPRGDPLERGDRGGRVRLLRRRLAASGDLPEHASLHRSDFNSTVEEAVKRFQARHGLAADGVVGPGTLAALNVPAAERAEQMALNMERWRWLPEELGERHVRVHITDGWLEAHDLRQASLGMKVMVGKPEHPTPSFSDTLSYLVFNPAWEIPASIAERLLPWMQSDSTFFARNNIEVYAGWRSRRQLDPLKVDWAQYGEGNLPFRFRQLPGRFNSMGRVKFMFPNAWSIYLHDTPSRYLFARDRRTFTSGCVRVRKPLTLATWLVQGMDGWDNGEVHDVIRQREEVTLPLDRPVPVHLLYLTAWVDDLGTIQFRPDVYGWDIPLREALERDARFPLVFTRGDRAPEEASLPR